MNKDNKTRVCASASSLRRKAVTGEPLTIDVLRKKTLLQMAEKRFMLSWMRFCGDKKRTPSGSGSLHHPEGLFHQDRPLIGF